MRYIERVARRSWAFIQKPETTNLVMTLATVAIAFFTWFTYEVVRNGSDDNKKLIAAAQTQAKVASEEPRAWVGVLNIDNVSFSDQTGLAATIVFFNSGKTPAWNARSSLGFIASATPQSGPTPDEIQQLQFRAAQSIPPQGRYNLYVGLVGGEKSTPQQILGLQKLLPYLPSIREKKMFLYYYGILKYDDNLGNHRDTQYCAFLVDATARQTAMCDAFNDLD